MNVSLEEIINETLYLIIMYLEGSLSNFYVRSLTPAQSLVNKVSQYFERINVKMHVLIIKIKEIVFPF